MRTQKVACGRCGKTTSIKKAHNWNVVMKKGRVSGLICHSCQTVNENLEAEINLATTNYSTDSFGRAIGSPKLGLGGQL